MNGFGTLGCSQSILYNINQIQSRDESQRNWISEEAKGMETDLQL